MQLQEAKVLKVPTYTFHDPFQKYVAITEGEHPESLDAIKVIPGTVDRFEKACLGWVKYAPFLIRMTADSKSTYQSRIQAMKEELTDIGIEIDKQLGWQGFNQLGPTLEKYDVRSKQDVAELYKAREGWNLISKSL
jgi:hypothetical protein